MVSEGGVLCVCKGNHAQYLGHSLHSASVRAIDLTLGSSLPYTDASLFVPWTVGFVAQMRECRSLLLIVDLCDMTRVVVVTKQRLPAKPPRPSPSPAKDLYRVKIVGMPWQTHHVMHTLVYVTMRVHASISHKLFSLNHMMRMLLSR